MGNHAYPKTITQRANEPLDKNTASKEFTLLMHDHS